MSKVMLLRTCRPDGSSKYFFRWPLTPGAEVEAPDWSPEPRCGGGLHGLLWGEGDANLIPTDGKRVWIAFEADEDDVVCIDSHKAKVRKARVVVVGTREQATQAVHAAAPKGTQVHYLSMTVGDDSVLKGGYGSTLVGGHGSLLIGGPRSTLVGGDQSTLTGGDGSTLVGGEGSTLNGGEWSTLMGGHRSKLTSGGGSTLTGGNWSTLKGGTMSTLIGGSMSTLIGGHRSTLCWHDWDSHVYRVITAYVGEYGIEAGKPYTIEDGKVVAVETTQ